MNFSTHMADLVRAVDSALNQSKAPMVAQFQRILGTAKQLFRSEQFDFWLH